MSEISALLPTLIEVPAGPALIGTPERELSGLARRYGGTRESYREESPQHELRLAAFAIAAVPVTTALYAAYVVDTGARPPGAWRGPRPPEARLEHPVTDVSWEEAGAFCAWLAERSGVAFRLPDEAVWERAARGVDGRVFPWGDPFDPARANTREGGQFSTTPVGSYPDGASPCGARDMAGNVWEWTATRDAPYPLGRDGGRTEVGPGRQILRGGCYANPHGFARCACRFRLAPTARNEFTGFRLAVGPERSIL